MASLISYLQQWALIGRCGQCHSGLLYFSESFYLSILDWVSLKTWAGNFQVSGAITFFESSRRPRGLLISALSSHPEYPASSVYRGVEGGCGLGHPPDVYMEIGIQYKLLKDNY